MNYRERPIVIKAVQLRWDTWGQMCDFASVGRLEDGKPQGCFVWSDGTGHAEDDGRGVIGLWIPTVEGLVVASQNDWVIKGLHGELYACKPDIFKVSYESTEDEPTKD